MASPDPTSLRHRLYVIIFEHDTPAGRWFDVGLLWAVVLSVSVVVIESVDEVRRALGGSLQLAEWLFTLIFTIEYSLRLYSAPSRSRYAVSFFGMVDLLAIVPTYASVFVPGTQSLLVVRVLRLLRVFRVLKLVSFRGEADALVAAIRASMPKVTVFLFAVLSAVIIVGASMYLVEGPSHGFTSIPRAMYWAIVTLTTVGFGDITPQTPVGQLLASALMILGYGIIAVPTGIVSAEMARATGRGNCPRCTAPGHQPDASFCRRCGARLSDLDLPVPPSEAGR
ncbi:MAG: ion transporter [Polyangiaceae bacterium]|nr:ion transporter [Polyangiaceae bacterium]